MGPDPERDVLEGTGNLEHATGALSPIAQIVTRQLEAAERLQRIATQLISARGTEMLYGQILDTALAILHADVGSIQKFCFNGGTQGELHLLTHRGFSPEAVQRWKSIQSTACTTCGEVLRTGRRVAVPDVRECNFMAGSEDLEGYLAANIRAGLSTPLVSRSGDLMGVVSTYWREPHDLSVSETRAMDVLARMAADLIERSLAEDRLAESEAHLKNAERIARLGHWQWDLQSNRISGSEEMFRIFGRPPDFVPSYETFLSDLLPQDRERVEKLVQDSLERKVGQSLEYRVFRPDGDLRTISCIWEVSVDSEGVPVRIFGTCQDITDSRRAQQEAFARQNLESVGALASGIAHDFNNLLGGVLAQAELGLSERTAGASPEQQLQLIVKAALRGSEIVRQLMMYAGTESTVVEDVDLSQIVAEMLELLKVSVSKHARLQTDLASDLPAVKANAAQIRQIVLNLVTNASDAIGSRDGLITVVTRRGNAVPGTAGDELAGGHHVLLEVTDNGCGMTPETQSRAFDPFFTTKSAGHGLGLAVVQGTVRALGGTILLASEPDKGTKFEILLPCTEIAAGARSDAGSAKREIAHRPQGGTLLLVEDERSLRQAIARMLHMAGFQIFEAADGSTAIDLLRLHGDKIDLVLLDMTIPGARSEEVVAEAARVRPDMPVILTSAFGQEIIPDSIKTSPACKFIRKPFQIQDLLKMLGDTLSIPAAKHSHTAAPDTNHRRNS
jgi:PAS domain S-box-containing protein